MKNYRLLLVGFVSVSYVFLSGFNQAVDKSPTPQDVKKHHAAKHPDTVLTDKAKVDDAKELQRPLDLTIPFKDAKDAEESGQAGDGTQGAADALFAPKPKKTEQPVQLKGGWLMSPEPEEEKKKSVDGAGIIIDLKP